MTLYGLTEEQKKKWDQDGFLVFENFLSEKEVALYNERMDDAFAKFRKEGRKNHELAQMKHVEQINGIIEYDEVFLDLMEHPRMMNIMRDIMSDRFIMIDNDALLKPPQETSHTNWHRDTSTKFFIGGKEIPFMAKVFYFLSDVHPDGGCLAFLPGSVQMTDDQLPKVEKQEDMPGHVRMSVKKGTAVLFNGYTYHSALNNYTNDVRRSLIYNYGANFVRTWPGYEPSPELCSREASNLRRMLLGVTPWVSDPQAFEPVAR